MRIILLQGFVPVVMSLDKNCRVFRILCRFCKINGTKDGVYFYLTLTIAALMGGIDFETVAIAEAKCSVG